MSRLDDDRELVERLDDLDDDDLTEWEVGFITDMHERVIENNRCMTDGMREKAEEILDEKE